MAPPGPSSWSGSDAPCARSRWRRGLAPYLRYYSSHRPIDDHGEKPAVLVVFHEELAVTHFLRVAVEEMVRTRTALPLLVSHRGLLEREGPLTIEGELEDLKKRLGRIWNFIETSDTKMADASDRIREHRERKEKLEVAAEEARRRLAERRQFLDSADTIAIFAAEMGEFLKTSELTETRAFVHSFVKEVVVKPGRGAIVYSIPTPDDSPMGGADAAEAALNRRVMNSVQSGGPGCPATGSWPTRCDWLCSY